MFLFMVHFAWLLAQAITACSLLLPVVLHIAYYVKKFLQKQLPASEELFEEKDYAIVITIGGAAQNSEAAILSFLQLNYSNYLIYVVTKEHSIHPVFADEEKVVLLPPADEMAGETGLHQYAINNFKRPHTHVVFFDGNCLADAEYLNELNVCFNQGYQAVRGVSATKYNSLTANAVYTLHHLYNCFFRGKVLFALGSSATVTNKGMAFNLSFYKRHLQSENAVVTGITSRWQNAIVSQGYQIACASTAFVFEEEAIHVQQIKTLHSNSIAVWSKQFGSHLKLLCKGIFSFNANCFLLGMMLLQLPLFTTLLSAVFCIMINVWINPVVAIFWMVGLLLFSLSFWLMLRSYPEFKMNSQTTKRSAFANLQLINKKRKTESYTVQSA